MKILSIFTVIILFCLSGENVHAHDSDNFRGNQIYYKVIEENISLSNKKIFKGSKVKIGILDTGIDIKNKNFNIKKGISYVNTKNNIDDINGHGTNVAGIINSSREYNNRELGIAPKAEIYIIKSLDNDGLSKEQNIINGVKWAIKNDLDILNMSIGTEKNFPNVKKIIDEAYNLGIFIVAPVGNSESYRNNDINYPAKYKNVFSVGSINSALEKSFFSNEGRGIDMVYYGEDIYTEGLDKKPIYATGTSMAAPYITGVVALLLEANPNLNNTEIRNILEATSTNLGIKEKYGFGIPNLQRALNLALLNEKYPVIYRDRIRNFKCKKILFR